MLHWLWGGMCNCVAPLAETFVLGGGVLFWRCKCSAGSGLGCSGQQHQRDVGHGMDHCNFATRTMTGDWMMPAQHEQRCHLFKGDGPDNVVDNPADNNDGLPVNASTTWARATS